MKKILLMTSLVISLLIVGCTQNDAQVTQSVDTPTNVSEADTVEETTTAVGRTDIQFVRNATMKIQYAGKTFLTDPMFSEKESQVGFLNSDVLANPTADLPLEVDRLLEDVEAIFVSHTHIPAADVDGGFSDHFDSVAIDVINKDMPIYLQPFDEAGIKRVGFNNVTAIEEQLIVDHITITRFEGIHADVDALLPLVGESSGYIFEAEGSPTIMWTGDVLLTDDIREVIKKHQPDLIIAHTGGARLPIDAEGHVSKLVMDAKDAIEIAQLAPEAKVIAIHMESLDHCPVTRAELREKASQAGISEDRMIIPEDGEFLSF